MDRCYLDDVIGAVQEELDTNKNSCDHQGSDDCACHSDDHVFPGDTWLLGFLRIFVSFRLHYTNTKIQTTGDIVSCSYPTIPQMRQKDERDNDIEKRRYNVIRRLRHDSLLRTVWRKIARNERQWEAEGNVFYGLGKLIMISSRYVHKIE